LAVPRPDVPEVVVTACSAGNVGRAATTRDATVMVGDGVVTNAGAVPGALDRREVIAAASGWGTLDDLGPPPPLPEPDETHITLKPEVGGLPSLNADVVPAG
jgi:hypothetical protein